MRIDFLFFLILSPYLINFVNGGCLLSELKEPEIGFDKWVCNADTTQDVVPYNSKCVPVCKEGYISVATRFRKAHKCVPKKGWKNRDSSDMICEIDANHLQEQILYDWRVHMSFDAVQLIEDPSLNYNETFDDDSVMGVYWSKINGNYGFMCNKYHTINQHAANLLCESVGLRKAKTGEGEKGGWFIRDPNPQPRDIPSHVAYVTCNDDTTKITECRSSTWGRGLGSHQGCKYKHVLWLHCEK